LRGLHARRARGAGRCLPQRLGLRRRRGGHRDHRGRPLPASCRSRRLVESLSRDEVADVLETIAPDLERVEAVLLEATTAGTPFLTESASYLTKAGGKRLRPALVALSSRLWAGCGPRADSTGAAIELTHH